MPKNRLQQFVDDARKRVVAGFYQPKHQLTSNGRLTTAIAGAVIAELKPRSPSEGRLLQRPAQEVLDAYVEGGASALSVLTDGDHFDGSPDLLAQAHATGLPTLMKDFVVDVAQLECAKACGASAVLLIERIFAEPEQREALVAAAHARGLEVLLEVFNAADWQRAQTSQAELIGVNSRDLETLRVDVAGSAQLLSAIAAERPVVALSGIASRFAKQAAHAAGATAVLVGTHLLKSPDPGLWLTALRRPLAKVCGIQDTAALEAAHEAGADMVGFVVGAPESPRNISPMQAQVLRDLARDRGLRTVLVTPHPDSYEVREWCRIVKPDWVQLHGTAVDEEWIHAVGSISTFVMQAIRPGDPAPATLGLLADGQNAGSGEAHDWSAAASCITQHGGFSLIAGGLNAGNAAQAIRESGAWGADASSSLESAPGQKDPQAIAAFVKAVQAAT